MNITGRDFMRRMDLSANTFYRRVREYEIRNGITELTSANALRAVRACLTAKNALKQITAQKGFCEPLLIILKKST